MLGQSILKVMFITLLIFDIRSNNVKIKQDIFETF